MNRPSLEAQHAALVYFSLEVARPFVHWAGLGGTGRILVNSDSWTKNIDLGTALQN